MSTTEIFEKIPHIQQNEAAPETNAAELGKVIRSRTAEIGMVISAVKRAPNGIYGRQLRCDKSLSVFEV